MRDDEATSRLRNLFISYNAILRKHAVGWVTADNPKIAARHVTSAVWPKTLRT